MKIVCSDRRGIYGYGIRQWGRGGGSGQSIIRSDSPVDHRCGQQVNGRQLKEQFAQLHPETSILYISGYTDDILAQYDLDQGTPFLEKPFTTETIIKQVNEILHRSLVRSRFIVSTNKDEKRYAGKIQNACRPV